MPVPTQVVYSASKYAVVGLSEALRGEAALHGIGVSVICPGFVSSNIAKSVRWRLETEHCPSEQHLVDKSTRIMERRDFSPDIVGERVVWAVERDKGVVPVGAETYLLDYIHRLFRFAGRPLQKAIIRAMQKTF
jgi:short-subunit dehydrogenase